MIMRATQKKMMSKPVTSTDDGRNVRSSRVSSGQPSVEWHHSADENHVSSTSGSRGTSPARDRAGPRRRACAPPRRARHEGVARLVVPRGNLVAPPELARDAPVLDVVDPLVVGGSHSSGTKRVVPRSPVAGCTMPASPTAARQSCCIVLPGHNVRGRRRLRHRHEPLVRQHRLDDLAGASAARHRHACAAFRSTSRPAASRSASTALRAA